MNTKAYLCCLLSLLVLVSAGMKKEQASRYHCENGKVQLKSDASLELIKASSNKLRGLIDIESQTFAWSVEMRSFEGFNSPLQREHFNENYLESDRYPKASFSGKIIEKVDFTQPGVQSVRAKGKFSIHGIEQERIIKSQIEIKDGKIYVSSVFTVPIADHTSPFPK